MKISLAYSPPLGPRAQALGAHRGVQFPERALPPGQDVLPPAHCLPDAWRRRRHSPVLDRLRRLRPLEQFVRGRYDGDYDKTNLPGELILTNYFTVRDDEIVSMIVTRNTPTTTDSR